MDWLSYLFDLFLHLDEHLEVVLRDYGTWTYVILFAIVFCETGFVLTPFLPGDSLLFAAGALATLDSPLNVHVLFVLLTVAAVLGDSVNYWVGASIGPRAFSGKIPLLNQHHLERTRLFYEKHGGKTIILARFIPIVRTFAPFVAGMGRMTYAKFMAYNVIGGLTWVWLFLLLGYFVGEKPFFQKNFTAVIFAIVFISIIPPIVEFWRERRRLQRAAVMPESSGETVSPPRGSNPS